MATKSNGTLSSLNSTKVMNDMVTNANNTSRTSTIGSIKSTGGSSVQAALNVTDVTGIDVAGIAKIKSAVKDFVDGYSKKISGVSIATSSVQAGIKGTASEKAIINLANAIKQSVRQTLQKLNTFADQLDTVKSSYSTNDTSNTSAQTYANNITNKINK